MEVHRTLLLSVFFFLFDASGTAAYPESGRPVLRSAVRKCARPEVAFSSFPPLVVIFTNSDDMPRVDHANRAAKMLFFFFFVFLCA